MCYAPYYPIPPPTPPPPARFHPSELPPVEPELPPIEPGTSRRWLNFPNKRSLWRSVTTFCLSLCCFPCLYLCDDGYPELQPIRRGGKADCRPAAYGSQIQDKTARARRALEEEGLLYLRQGRPLTPVGWEMGPVQEHGKPEIVDPKRPRNVNGKDTESGGARVFCDQMQSGFFSQLSYDVREQIYRDLIFGRLVRWRAGNLQRWKAEEHGAGIFEGDEASTARLTDPIEVQLLRTCRRIYLETVPLLYRNNLFQTREKLHDTLILSPRRLRSSVLTSVSIVITIPAKDTLRHLTPPDHSGLLGKEHFSSLDHMSTITRLRHIPQVTIRVLLEQGFGEGPIFALPESCVSVLEAADEASKAPDPSGFAADVSDVAAIRILTRPWREWGDRELRLISAAAQLRTRELQLIQAIDLAWTSPPGEEKGRLRVVLGWKAGRMARSSKWDFELWETVGGKEFRVSSMAAAAKEA